MLPAQPLLVIEVRGDSKSHGARKLVQPNHLL
jgi:hypothetical protein